MITRKAAVYLLVALVTASCAWSVGSINAVVDKPQVTVGEPFIYTVTLILPAGAQAKLPGEQVKLGKLEVRGYQPTETPQPDGSRQVVLAYTLVAFDVGQQEIGDFTVPVTDAQGKAEKYLAPPVAVTVKSVLPAKGDAQPKGFYGPVTLKSPWAEWLLAAAIALLVIGVVVLVVWLLRRRKRPRKTVTVEEILPADEAALRALRRLAEDRVAASGDMLGFYLRLDEILRAWLEARFEVPAMNRTTAGLVYLLRVRGDTEPWRKGLLELLRAGDAVKFAKAMPDDDQAYRDVGAAEEVVHMAAPPPPVPASGEGVAPR
jgi:hypothetical protein